MDNSNAETKAQRAIESLYRWYLAHSQAKRNWNPDTSFDWDSVNRNQSEQVIRIIEGFYAVEQFVPDYTSGLVYLLRHDYGRSQFYCRWGAEEAKHADLWRNALLATCGRRLQQIEQYTNELRQKSWELPFGDPLEMLFYTVLQERATQVNYHNLALLFQGKAEGASDQTEADPVLVHVARSIAADEAAHFEFYLAAAQIYLYFFPSYGVRALLNVLASFEMPAASIVPNYREFIDALYGAGIFGRRKYVRDVVGVCLKHLGIHDLGKVDEVVRELRRVSKSGEEACPEKYLPLFDPHANERAVTVIFERLKHYETASGLGKYRAVGFEM
jgi:acyl-[acyl-carrier-protein] desaturase